MDALVCETQNAKALGGEPGVADWIAKTVFMMRTVGFDNHAMTQAEKIDDISTERDLAAKLQAVQSPVP